MKTNKKLSLIIPTYNSEKTICRCIDSILKSKINDYEIIIIDDGSTDNTALWLNQYANKYSNIIVLHTKNNGVSIARNIGMRYATGEYLTFIDSDDYVTEVYVDFLLKVIKSQKDLYIFKALHNKDVINKWIKKSRNIDIEELKQTVIKGKTNPPWDKVYKRKIIQNNSIQFRERISLGEDWIFIMDYIECCRYIELLDKVLYYYTDNSGSLTNKKMNIQMLKGQISLFDRIACFDTNDSYKYSTILQVLLSSCSKLHRNGYLLTEIYSCFENKEWYNKIINANFPDIKNRIRRILMERKCLKIASLFFGKK